MESFRDAQAKAGLVILLEPIMNVVVLAPEQYQGTLAGDINRRRGNILNLQPRQGPLHDARLHSAGGAVRLHAATCATSTSGTASFTHGAQPLRRR